MVEKLKQEYNVDVEWRPFYLYWDIPLEGKDLPEHVKRARANGSEERLAAIAKSYGMDFKSTARIYNTRLAHEATEYARENGKGNEFHKALFHRVYAKGQDPSKWSILRAAAEEVGLNAPDMQELVEVGRYKEYVEEQVQWAQQIGVTGVPTYVINERYAVVGAQPYEVFKNALTQIMNQKG